MSEAAKISVSLLGDVMTGRGVDQILPCAGGVGLHEEWVRDARVYVRLAERVNGAIGRPVGWEYVWGDLLGVLRGMEGNVVVANLETSVTRSEEWWVGKEVHYRMHPGNVGCLAAGGIGCWCLANNHVMDWGYAGLEETLGVLDRAGLRHAGAGRDAGEAGTAVVCPVGGRRERVVVVAVGSVTSGIPAEWGAGAGRAGVKLVGELSARSAGEVAGVVRGAMRPGDVGVVSVHWGGNWGYAVPGGQVEFAHRLVEEGVRVVHGHSSHHVKAAEVYRGGLILYGCGDLINDYEGIGGHEAYRTELRMAYVAEFGGGELVGVRLVPLRVRRMRLERATGEEARWLCDVMSREGRRFGTWAEVGEGGEVYLRWG